MKKKWPEIKCQQCKKTFEMSPDNSVFNPYQATEVIDGTKNGTFQESKVSTQMTCPYCGDVRTRQVRFKRNYIN